MAPPLGGRSAREPESDEGEMARNTSRNFDFMSKWRSRARKALNSGVRPEISVGAALEESYREGLQRAATYLQENGFPELAQKVTALLDQDRTTR
jgi:hypothetical protein